MAARPTMVTGIAISALALLALANGVNARNETRRKRFALRMSSREEKVRVIHGSGGGWPAEDSVRMMQPYWDAQVRAAPQQSTAAPARWPAPSRGPGG